MDKYNQPFPGNISLVVHPSSFSGVQTGSYPGNPYGFETQNDDSEGALVKYWRLLRRHFKGILLTSLIGMVLGAAIGIPMRPVYRAKTSLEVLTLNEDFMNLKQANPTTTNDNSFDTSEEQTQAKLLQSDALINRVIAKLDPGSSAAPVTPKFATHGWRSWFHLTEPVELTARQKLLLKAADTLKVRPTARTRILEVSVDSSDRQLAADFANTLTQEFMAQSVEARWSSTQHTSEWLRRELEDARGRLRNSEDALQTYARGSGLIFTDETTNVATEKLQQVQQSLSNATADRIAKQARYQMAQSSPPESLADVLNDETLQGTEARLNELKQQIADASTVFSPEYSKVRRLQAELQALQASADSERQDILARIKTDFTQAAANEKLLTAAYVHQAQEVTGQDEKAIQYNILKRDVDSNRQLYDVMLQQMKQASIASAMRASNVRVVDPAALPDKAVFPNFPLNAAVGFVAGLLFSVGVVTIRDRADRTLQQPGDVKLWLEIPELGTIPSALSAGQKAPYALYNRLADTTDRTAVSGRSSARKELIDVVPGSKSSIELITFQNKPSLVAEAFRSVLTSILFVGDKGGSPRVIAFTSANPADGKTTVASNVGIAAAEIRIRVLIIDADLRRPRMHHVFSLPNEQGLSNILAEESDDETVTGLIQETAIRNLHVLPAGPPTNSAAHLLYSANFATTIESLRKKYDLILIDTPPMMQMTDARVVGRLADGMILVARAGRTTRDALLAAKDRLAEDKIRIFGAVLNDWDTTRSSNGYYYAYRGRYSGYDNAYVARS